MSAHGDFAGLGEHRPAVPFRDGVIYLRPMGEWTPLLFAEIHAALGTGHAAAACRMLLGPSEHARLRSLRPTVGEVVQLITSGVRIVAAELGRPVAPSR